MQRSPQESLQMGIRMLGFFPYGDGDRGKGPSTMILGIGMGTMTPARGDLFPMGNLIILHILIIFLI